MIGLLLALSVTVDPAFLPCRPTWSAGAAVVEARSPDEDRRVAVELADYLGRIAAVELDLPARSHKRLVVMPPLVGRVTATLVEEDGTRTPLAYPVRPECRGPSIAALVRDDGRTGVTLPQNIGGTDVEAGTISKADLGGSWRPLAALDSIAAEARALHELSDAELAVVTRWVDAGGVLVVVPGIDPGPFFRSGRLPGLASSWQSARRGAGFVVVAADLSGGDPRLGGVLAVNADERERWRKAAGRIFEAQRDRAGPAGRASRPGGVLSLGLCFLAAAAANELLRRRFVLGARDFPRYFQGLGTVLGVTAVSGILAAFAGGNDGASAELVLAHSSGSGIRSRAFLLGAGRERALADGAWPFAEREIRYVLGARNAVANGSAGTRVVLERTPFELPGTLALDGSRPLSLRNDTALRFEAGWILDGRLCSAVPSIGPGEELTRTGYGVCPTIPEVRQAAQATERGLVWYIARSDDMLFTISLEKP